MAKNRFLGITKRAVIDKIESMFEACICSVDCDYIEPEDESCMHEIFVQIDFKNDYISEFYVEFNIPEDEYVFSNIDDCIDRYIQFGFADNSIVDFSPENFWKLVCFYKKLS